MSEEPVRNCSRCGYPVTEAGGGVLCGHCAAEAPSREPNIRGARDDNEVRVLDGVPAEYTRVWDSEGWGMYPFGGVLEIQKTDGAGRFVNDQEAVAHVTRRALFDGSKAHLLALWLDGRRQMANRPRERLLPAELLPAEAAPTDEEAVTETTITVDLPITPGELYAGIQPINPREELYIQGPIDPPAPPMPHTGFADS